MSRTASNANSIVVGILYQWICNVTCISFDGLKTGILLCCLDKNINENKTVSVCVTWRNIFA